MEHSRYDWCRQELECVRSELVRLNHLRDYQPSMQFFSNELTAIDKLQAELVKREALTEEARQRIWWLAASLHYTDQPWSGYHTKLTCAAAMTAAVCGVMEGCRSSWMAPSPSWDIFV